MPKHYSASADYEAKLKRIMARLGVKEYSRGDEFYAKRQHKWHLLGAKPQESVT